MDIKELRIKLIALSICYNNKLDYCYKLYNETSDWIEKIPLKYISIAKTVKNAITIIDHNYPKGFLHLENPPIVIYYLGNESLLSELSSTTIGIIGTRNPQIYSKSILSGLLNINPRVIISGLASGWDTYAHEFALENNWPTIAVLGCGINYIYPKENEEIYKKIQNQGLIISEYFDKQEPSPDYFKNRNRLIAALSANLVIVEAKYKSGTMNTAKHALYLGKTIYCLPALFGIESGCNKLIIEGANMLTSWKDLDK